MTHRLVATVICVVAASGCSDRARASKEWLRTWDATRECLLGTVEHGDDTGGAVSVHWLMSGRTCGIQVGELAKVSMRRRAALAPGVVSAVMNLTGSPEDGAFIDRIEAFAVALRPRAGATAVPRVRVPLEALGAPLAVTAQGRELEAGDNVNFVHGRVTAEHLEPSQSWQVQVVDAKAPVVFFGPPMSVLAYPSRTWSACVDRGRFVVSDLAGHTSVPALDFRGGDYAASRAMDADDHRYVLLQSLDAKRPFAIAESSDRGSTWRLELVPEFRLDASSQDEEASTVDVISDLAIVSVVNHFELDTAYHFRRTRHDLPEGFQRVACRAHEAMWMVADGNRGLARVTPTSVTTAALASSDRVAAVDCSDDRALVLQHGETDSIQLCDAHGCARTFVARGGLSGSAVLTAAVSVRSTATGSRP